MEPRIGRGKHTSQFICMFVMFPYLQPQADASGSNPTLHLPHLLRILGPSALTLYKHILGRRRILIYTQPPVEAACILCQVAADMCYEDQVDYRSENDAQYSKRPTGKCKEGINVLGMVTLSDVDRLHHEGVSGRGWIACELCCVICCTSY